jgi:hypothetical protein
VTMLKNKRIIQVRHDLTDINFRFVGLLTASINLNIQNEILNYRKDFKYVFWSLDGK